MRLNLDEPKEAATPVAFLASSEQATDVTG